MRESAPHGRTYIWKVRAARVWDKLAKPKWSFVKECIYVRNGSDNREGFNGAMLSSVECPYVKFYMVALGNQPLRLSKNPHQTPHSVHVHYYYTTM